MSKSRLPVNQVFLQIFSFWEKKTNPCRLFLLSKKPVCQVWVEGAVLHELRALMDTSGVLGEMGM